MSMCRTSALPPCQRDNTQSLALGGITNGVTNLELTAAFATIANSGYYNEPIFYTQVLDHDGNVLLDNTSNESRQVLKETTAWLLTSAMQDVVNSGTGGRAKFSGMSIAGKPVRPPATGIRSLRALPPITPVWYGRIR